MEENKRKFDWKNVVIVIILGLLIFCVFKLSDMSENIASLESRVVNYQNHLSGLRSEIGSIYDNVDELLKKQASIVSSVDYTFGELDTTTHVVPLTLKVVPKILTDDTTLSVRIGETTADFTRNGNEFTAIIPVGLFIGDEHYPILSIKINDETKTEKLESVVIANLHYDYLPNVWVHIPPLYNFSKGKLNINSNLHLSVASLSSVTITKMELVTELNGEEIERQDVTSYAKNEDYEIAYNKTYNANEGDELVIYVIAEDSLGYIHKTRALYWMQKDGTVHEEAIVDKGGEIYDKNGNLLTK